MRRSLKAASLLVLAFYLAGIVPAYGQVRPPEIQIRIPVTNQADARLMGLESLRVAVALDGGVPLPQNLDLYVKNRQTAMQLGKALFWDMQVGSDGVQACASCHFHAGADNRAKNQMNPSEARCLDMRETVMKGLFFAPGFADTTFQLGGSNFSLIREDFPLVKTVNRLAITGTVVGPSVVDGNTNDVVSSQGVFFTQFTGVNPGSPLDSGIAQSDQVHNVDGVTVRRVPPRNSPTPINAVFFYSNFWDGRANNRFNGVNPFGDQDLNAHIFMRTLDNQIVPVRPSLVNASLASQAIGPPLSDFEMSHAGRSWPEVGKKLTGADVYPLNGQTVHEQDSLLGTLRDATDGKGLVKTYRQLIQEAFVDGYWDDSGLEAPAGLPAGYTLMEANFSFFFGIAVMLYEATLVSDQTPFDLWMEGLSSSFGDRELRGLDIFANKGKCLNCHAGPEFSNATVRNSLNGLDLIEPMAMAAGLSLYDNGFYNIAVTPTTDDKGRGGSDPFGRPLSFARQFAFNNMGTMKIDFPVQGTPLDLVVSPFCFNDRRGRQVCYLTDRVSGFVICRDDNGNGLCDKRELLLRRVVVDGAFKVPSLRNVELTGPYFHNGGVATLMQVVQFYDRGGNFCRFNLSELAPDITLLNLGGGDEDDLVAFLLSLTDERVRFERAPFDHPELILPNGHVGDENSAASVVVDGILQAVDETRVLPAVGAGGLATPLERFLGLDPFDAIFEPAADACFNEAADPIP